MSNLRTRYRIWKRRRDPNSPKIREQVEFPPELNAPELERVVDLLLTIRTAYEWELWAKEFNRLYPTKEAAGIVIKRAFMRGRLDQS